MELYGTADRLVNHIQKTAVEDKIAKSHKVDQKQTDKKHSSF